MNQTENLYGKYDKVVLVENDLSHSFHFPALKREVYTKAMTKPDRSQSKKVREDIRGLQRSTLLNLRGLLVFNIVGAVMQCTKFLISRVHGRSLWLDKEYPIHAVDIQRLTRLSTAGVGLSTVFQNTSKKTGDDNYYKRYGTQHGGKVP